MQGCSYRQLAAAPTAVGRTTSGVAPIRTRAGDGLMLDASRDPTDMARLGPMAEWLRRGLQINRQAWLSAKFSTFASGFAPSAAECDCPEVETERGADISSS